jgi:hypothetical protein
MKKDVFEIFNAWITSLNPTEDQLILAQHRAAICKDCEHKQQFIKDLKLAIICNLCGCPIQKKIFSNKNNPCPLKKWEEVDKKFKK